MKSQKSSRAGDAKRSSSQAKHGEKMPPAAAASQISAAAPEPAAVLPVEPRQPEPVTSPSDNGALAPVATSLPPAPLAPAPLAYEASSETPASAPVPVPSSRPFSVAAARPMGRRAFPPPVLVATADPSLSRMLTFALNQMRTPFKLLESGPIALRELLEMQVGTQPPIVLLDVDLPGVDGHAILERIGVKRPDTFLIVVLSGHADESVQVRSLLAGAIDHLAKPFNVRVLMAKLQRWSRVASHLTGASQVV